MRPRPHHLTHWASAANATPAVTDHLTAQLSQPPGPSVVRLAGEIDMAAVPRLLDVLEPMCARRASTVEIDLSEVSFLDSTGVNALMKLHRISEAATGTLLVSHPAGNVRRLFEITGVATMLRVA